MSKKKLYLPKLQKITSTDELRLPLQYVLIEDGVATATDGHKLMRVNVSDSINGVESLDNRLIHGDAWKLLTKSSHINALPSGNLQAKYGQIEIEVASYPNNGSKVEQYPNYKSILENYKKENLKKLTRISFQPEYINDIRIAMNLPGNGNALKLFFFGESKAILIFNDLFDGFCIVMPCMLEYNNTHANKEETSAYIWKNFAEQIEYLT